MRIEFCSAIDKVLAKDERSLLVTGDLGFNAFEGVRSNHSKRFVNAGVAEQNMTGVAAGMAMTGLTPWIYSIAPFAVYRCLEQIRNDICLHNLPVRIVGNGGGFTYGVMGSTHHALEDFAALKALPNLQLFFPCASDQVETAVWQIQQLKGPAYLRLSVSPFKTKSVPLFENSDTLTRQYRKGNIATIIGVGHAVQVALANSDDLNCDVFSISKFPFDTSKDSNLVESVQRTGNVIVIDEHYQFGGMAESLKVSLPNTKNFICMNAQYRPELGYGSAAFHLKQSAMTPEDLLKLVLQLKETGQNEH
jgi:transketolase